MKDNFSEHSKEYSRFRPGYPKELFRYLQSEINNFDNAWDCGTGNGQVALQLASFFENVYATDISSSQLSNASKKENIHYSLQPAEKTNFKPSMFDLITVGQAIHWFDFEQFYRETYRTLKPDGYIAVMGYGLLITNNQTSEIIQDLYQNIVGSFWDPERKYLDENYRTIPFPFREKTPPKFEYKVQWSLEHLTGYLKTWSGVKHYIKKNGNDPVDKITPKLQKAFGNRGVVTFPILFRLGQKI